MISTDLNIFEAYLYLSTCLGLTLPLEGVYNESHTRVAVLFVSLSRVALCPLTDWCMWPYRLVLLFDNTWSWIKPQPTSRSSCDDVTPSTDREGVVSWSCRDSADVTEIRHILLGHVQVFKWYTMHAENCTELNNSWLTSQNRLFHFVRTSKLQNETWTLSCLLKSWDNLSCHPQL